MIAGRIEVERGVAQGAPPGARGVRRIGAAVRQALVGRQQFCREAAAEENAQAVAGGEDRVGVDILADFAGKIRFARQGQNLRRESRVARALVERDAQRVGESLVLQRQFAGADRLDRARQKARRIGLDGLPAIEAVAVVPHQRHEIVLAQRGNKLHRRREAAQQRRHRVTRDIGEHDAAFRGGKFQNPMLDFMRAGTVARAGLRRDGPAVAADKPEGDGNDDRRFRRLTRRRLCVLRQVERQRLRRRVIGGVGRHDRRARLRIPAEELSEIASRGFGEAGHELLDRRGRAVVAVEIERHALVERRVADQRLEHADDFRALFVDRRRVEIVDLGILLRPHVMGERAGVLGELRGAQRPHFLNAAHGARTHVCGKLMVAEDRQAFLEAKLEPVAAGDAVAGPVVEIFVRDDRLDAGVIAVGRRLGQGEHVFVVEDVEALVFHGPHIEVGHGDHVEHVEIVFAAVDLLVPLHRADQRVHGVIGAQLLALLDINREFDMAARLGDEGLVDRAEIAADHGEEIGGLGMRIMPDGEMTAAVERAARASVAVRKQDRRFRLIRLQPRRIDAEHVRPVEEIGDAAEALRLALRAIGSIGAEQPHQLGVGRGIDLGLDLQRERPGGRLVDRQFLRRRRLGEVERRAVELH